MFNTGNTHDEDDGASVGSHNTGENELHDIASNHGKEEDSEEKLAEKETVLVNRSKVAVVLVVMLAAAATGVATFKFMETEERQWYEDEVRDTPDRCLVALSRTDAKLCIGF